MILIVKTKLLPTPEQAKMLLSTMERINEACNWLAGKAFKENTADKIRLHHEFYQELRSKFNLSSQMAVRVIGKVCDAFKKNRKIQPVFKSHSAVPYDQRILTFKAMDRVSILTLEGRIKIPFVVGDYFRSRLEGVRRQADLIFNKGKWYLYVNVEVPEEAQINPKEWMGVDLGIRNLAVDSDGDKHTGDKVEVVRQKQARLKADLQSVGTKSSKKKLKALSGKEARFRAYTNHTISKTLVSKAKDTGRGIALEDLKGISNRATVRRNQRNMHFSWGFYQLRSFIEYKARLSGVPVAVVPAYNTSITCPECDCINKRNRRSQAEFCCKSCGFSDHADHVGAINIARRAAVNQPIVAAIGRETKKLDTPLRSATNRKKNLR
jgi:IS605 OrfB family transposase